ncbi:hypothetical protein JOC86_001908 [Bacillus pakistanensis]|uniref:Uncharacterized protein n=1 Tax=Rossellomorea pakistanensis TaxID=992288 RepID=A0ABS2NBY5_9BACI|nr:hypothetical protein [Bacillus pakistanensis]
MFKVLKLNNFIVTPVTVNDYHEDEPALQI